MSIVFVDANLFLRYLTNDVPQQAEAVEQLLLRAGRSEIQLITNAMVMAELVWVMESSYGLSRKTIQEYVLAIVNTPGLEVDESELVIQAVFWYVEKNVDFIDAFNAAWMLQKGIVDVLTFDRKHFQWFSELHVLMPGRYL